MTGDTAKPTVTTFEVNGDFDAAALVKALNAAGFSAQVVNDHLTRSPGAPRVDAEQTKRGQV